LNDSTVCSDIQYKDAFLKENPTYKWYNPSKHVPPVVVSKCADLTPTSATHTHPVAATNVEQIFAGKLAGNGNKCC